MVCLTTEEFRGMRDDDDQNNQGTAKIGWRMYGSLSKVPINNI